MLYSSQSTPGLLQEDTLSQLENLQKKKAEGLQLRTHAIVPASLQRLEPDLYDKQLREALAVLSLYWPKSRLRVPGLSDIGLINAFLSTTMSQASTPLRIQSTGNSLEAWNNLKAFQLLALRLRIYRR